MTSPQPLAQFIRSRRVELGLSLQQLADRCGYSKGHMWDLERGSTTNPTISTLNALAAGLQVSGVKLFRVATEDSRETNDG